MPSKEYAGILDVLRSLPDAAGLSFAERRSNFEAQASQLPVAENVACEPYPWRIFRPNGLSLNQPWSKAYCSICTAGDTASGRSTRTAAWYRISARQQA